MSESTVEAAFREGILSSKRALVGSYKLNEKILMAVMTVIIANLPVSFAIMQSDMISKRRF